MSIIFLTGLLNSIMVPRVVFPSIEQSSGDDDVLKESSLCFIYITIQLEERTVLYTRLNSLETQAYFQILSVNCK